MDNSVEKTPKTSVRRRNYRPAIFVAIGILIIGVVILIITLNRHSGDNPKDTETSSSVEIEKEKEKENELETKSEKPVEKEVTSETPEDEGIVEGKTPVNLDQGSQTDLDALTGVVNYAASDGETVMIRISIDQYLEIGECVLELTTIGDSFSLTDEILPSASTSSCSFDISTDLLTGGKYDIKVTVKSGDKEGVIKGEIEV